MSTSASPEARAVRAVLGRVARRLWVRQALRWTLRAAAIGLAALVVALLAHDLAVVVPDPRRLDVLAALALALLLAALPALRPVRLVRAATAADAACGLSERLTTALEVMGQPTPMARLVVRDAARSTATIDLRRIPVPAIGRDAWMVAAGIVVGVALWVHGPRPPAPEPRDRDASAPVAARPTDAARSSADPSRRDVSSPSTALREALRADREQARPDTSDLRGAPAPVAPTAARSVSPAPGAGASAGAARAPEASVASVPSPSAAGASRVDAGATGAAGGGKDASVSGDAARTLAPAGRGLTAAAAGARGQFAPADEPARPTIGAESSAATGALGVSPPGGLARMPVPPALRRYVQRYFEELR